LITPKEKDSLRRETEWLFGGPARMRASADCEFVHAGIATTVGLAVFNLAIVFGMFSTSPKWQFAAILAQGAVSALTLFVWRLRWNRLEKAEWTKKYRRGSK
jgi:hypothetical protein